MSLIYIAMTKTSDGGERIAVFVLSLISDLLGLAAILPYVQ